MKRLKSIVLFGNGINCEKETYYAHKISGFSPQLVFINDLLERPQLIHRAHFITLPGGFLDGDDLGAAKAQAVKWKYKSLGKEKRTFVDELLKFIQDGKLILGICNGFQLLVKIGLLPAIKGDYKNQVATLTYNDNGRFEDRWVYLKVNESSRCVFTKGMDLIYLPVRHGEGKFVSRDSETLETMMKDGHVVLQYAKRDGSVTYEYPFNPNGSQGAVAGICDPTGRIFGLMPHPEAYISRLQHPRWLRGEWDDPPHGLRIFLNAYDYCSKNL